MTVSTVVDHNDYIGNGITTSFPYTFRIFKKSDLTVSVIDLNENIFVLVLDTDYTVTNAGGYSGGNVVLSSALSNGWKISIAREIEPTQETDLRNQGKFFAETHENVFDKLTMLIQQGFSWLRLALRKPSSIANWYDGLNNYIRNVRDPRYPQDAATKNYVDGSINSNTLAWQAADKSLNDKIDLNNSRALRVSSGSISPFPSIEARRNKQIGFGNSGDVELSDPAGTGLWGYETLDSFEDGITLTERFQVLRYKSTGEYYRWDGAYPKFVPPESTPSTAGGIGLGKWLSVGDASLRSDLLAGPMDTRGTGLALRNLVTVSDFGGISGFNFDSSVALVAFINHINSGVNENATYLVDGLYKTTVDLPDINRPVHLTGTTPANSAILFSGLNKGLRFDFRNLSGEKNPGTVFSKLSLLTDRVATGSAVQLLAETLGNTRMVRFWGDDFQIDSLTRFLANAGRSSQEWKCAIEIGDVTGGGFHSVRLSNFNIYGADDNDLYTTLTSTGSDGIIVRNSSGLFVEKAKIYLLSGTGVKTIGQCEGTIINNSEIVAVRNGAHYSAPVNPSNHHSLRGSHIAPYERGIIVDEGTSDASTPLANYFSQIFILERDTEVVKANGFIGVECLGKFSHINNVTVYSGSGSPNSSIAFVVGREGNSLENCFARRQVYVLKVVGYTGFTSTISPLVNNLTGYDTVTAYLHPASVTMPTGISLDGKGKLPSTSYDSPTLMCNTFSLTQKTTQAKMYAFGIGNMDLYPATGNTATQFSHWLNGAASAQAQIQFVGGDGTTSNSGGINYKATNGHNFRGNVCPETPNTWTCGKSSLAWAGGFTQTAFTVTSDERAKTKPVPITDEMLDAVSEVNWVQYQYLDRVDAKGPDGARWHFGAVAQRFVEAFEHHGLDPFRFAFLCYDEWDHQPEVTQHFDAEYSKDGELIRDARTEVVQMEIEAGSRYGIRYEEVLVLEAALQRRNFERLKSDLEERIKALEGK